MKHYIGTKQIKARPMTRKEYNEYRGWEHPSDEDGKDEGYLVEYFGGGKANHPDHMGYISWSPKDVFDKAYRSTEGMSFGLAIEAVKKGYSIARKGWNGKNQYVFLVKADLIEGIMDSCPNDDSKLSAQPALAMKTTANQVQVGWLASQTDMLCDDWCII